MTAAAPLLDALASYEPRSADERRDVARIEALARASNPWDRSTLLHVTASALIVHPPTRRVLLRWHERMESWLQVGGHGDPGENDPCAIALREAREETGLPDVVGWPIAGSPTLLQVVIVPVPAGRGEPFHEHADIRYLLATERPEMAAAETAAAHVAWLRMEDAMARVAEENLRVCLRRVAALLT